MAPSPVHPWLPSLIPSPCGFPGLPASSLQQPSALLGKVPAGRDTSAKKSTSLGSAYFDGMLCGRWRNDRDHRRASPRNPRWTPERWDRPSPEEEANHIACQGRHNQISEIFHISFLSMWGSKGVRPLGRSLGTKGSRPVSGPALCRCYLRSGWKSHGLTGRLSPAVRSAVVGMASQIA